MTTEELLNELDLEIARLQQVRSILANESTKPGKKLVAAFKANKKWKMSPEARAKIAAAQRKRWAAQRKAAK